MNDEQNETEDVSYVVRTKDMIITEIEEQNQQLLAAFKELSGRMDDLRVAIERLSDRIDWNGMTEH